MQVPTSTAEMIIPVQFVIDQLMLVEPPLEFIRISSNHEGKLAISASPSAAEPNLREMLNESRPHWILPHPIFHECRPQTPPLLEQGYTWRCR